MEDKEPKVDRFEAASYERVIEHFISKQVSSECQVCGKSEGWTVTPCLDIKSDLTRYFGLAHVDSVGGLYLQGTYPVIICTCNNCGYMRLHSAAAIAKSLQEAGAANNTESEG